MAVDDQHSARASGYSVEDDTEGGFNWSAFGPAGTLSGHADSQAEGEAAARNAEQELCRPRRADA